MSSAVTVIRERSGVFKVPEVITWHLAKGRGDDDWQDVWCGGGIVMPSRFKVHPDDVCPACKAARSEHRRAR